MILTHRAVLTVLTFLIKLLLPRVPESPAANQECSEIHEKIFFIPGHVFDCRPARRDSGDLHKNSRNLATSSGVLRREGIEKSGAKNHCNQYLCLVFRGAQNKKSRRWKSSYVYDKLPCCGYWDLYSKRHDNSELSFLGDASGKIP